MLKKKVTISIALLIISSICLGQGWFKQNSGTISNLNSVKFNNLQTGWCVGDSGKILKTTNGGLNWMQLSLGYSTSLSSISFTDSNIGYIVGNSVFLKTTNGGSVWQNLSFQSGILNSVFFVNNLVGYAGGDSVYGTTNGGIDWIRIGIEIVRYCNSMYFVNASTGWLVGATIFTLEESVLKSTNNGLNWVVSYYTGRTDDIKSVFFIDSLNGWIGSPDSQLGSGRKIFKTTNGGANWFDPTPMETPVNLSYSLYFIDTNHGWSALDGGQIWHTSNGGLNWLSQISGNENFTYRSIFFVDSLTGWCVGDSGRILKTTTGGLTYTANSNSEIPEEYSLSQNYPNPFNPKTIINVQCAMYNNLTLKVYDVLGNEVSTLLNEKKSPGSYEVEFDGSNFPSGIYFYRLEVDGNVIDSKRMALVK